VNLERELADLNDQYERMKKIEDRRYNHLNQKLLGYHEGFTWCPGHHSWNSLKIKD
jgi:hypothetical protein